MPRYFFHVRNGIGFTEGRELSGPEEARAVALKGARSPLSAEVEEGRLDLSGRLDVVDAENQPLFQITFEEAIALKRGAAPSS